ncbi:hypothetical protein PHISP_01363 [Aspergillus sp. HF37]|nr:hypothetical protein PHISP_01363 [Aspergillus sp. HF37]
MMSQSLRASRTLLSRATRQQFAVPRRSFLTSAVRQADPIQDLYLRELRAYKPQPIKPAPQSPEEASLANELQTYETQGVEVEGQAAAGEPTPVEENWLEVEEDESSAAH